MQIKSSKKKGKLFQTSFFGNNLTFHTDEIWYLWNAKKKRLTDRPIRKSSNATEITHKKKKTNFKCKFLKLFNQKK